MAQQAAPTLPPYLRQGLVPNWIDPNAQVKWPPNDGCAATPEPVTLPVGTLIDRFGSEGGHYFSPKGESFAARALPYVCSQMVFTVYRVAKPLPVTTCKTAPWFGEPGGATQYQTAEPAFKLRETGSIEVATGDGAGNDEPASPCRSS
ncbi:MAG: TNT domain-containing protein [Acetobacteraceae bacterium]